MLLRKEEELTHRSRDREEIAVERSADQSDEIRHAMDREFVIRGLDASANTLRQVKAALRRIDDGSFGVCMECDEDINVKRLAAVPWASCCIRCQEAAEREERQAESLVASEAA